jgi:hypothetical protein
MGGRPVTRVMSQCFKLQRNVNGQVLSVAGYRNMFSQRQSGIIQKWVRSEIDIVESR